MSHSDLTDDQIATALAVEATATGAAAVLSAWHDCTITAMDVLQRVEASPRLQRVAAFCAEAQGSSSRRLTEERIRAMAGPGRWWERRARRARR
jgi:hypothetical protein